MLRKNINEAHLLGDIKGKGNRIFKKRNMFFYGKNL